MNNLSLNKIIEILKNEYPNSEPELDYKNSLELLIATILSAQCTDKRVNIVTKSLFKKYNTPKDYAVSDLSDLEQEIYSTGFYKQKAKNIKACCRKLLTDFGGEIPADFDKLNSLPGVGRKTASVVAANAFNIPAIAVDTHVKRVTNRLGLVTSNSPEKIELELKKIFSKKYWIKTSHWFILLGRYICIARKPKCEVCKLTQYCKYFNKGK